MKRKLMMLLFAVAMLLTVSAAPVYACDADGNEDPPPCSDCDGFQSGHWG